VRATPVIVMSSIGVGQNLQPAGAPRATGAASWPGAAVFVTPLDDPAFVVALMRMEPWARGEVRSTAASSTGFWSDAFVTFSLVATLEGNGEATQSPVDGRTRR
jgi:hypothetical protein